MLEGRGGGEGVGGRCVCFGVLVVVWVFVGVSFCGVAVD